MMLCPGDTVKKNHAIQQCLGQNREKAHNIFYSFFEHSVLEIHIKTTWASDQTLHTVWK